MRQLKKHGWMHNRFVLTQAPRAPLTAVLCRLRMITSMFLIKVCSNCDALSPPTHTAFQDLMLDWRLGELVRAWIPRSSHATGISCKSNLRSAAAQHFSHLLIDADLASNNGGWCVRGPSLSG